MRTTLSSLKSDFEFDIEVPEAKIEVEDLNSSNYLPIGLLSI